MLTICHVRQGSVRSHFRRRRDAKNVDRYFAIERSIRTSELAGIAKSILALVSELNDRLSDEAYGSLFEGADRRRK